VSRAGSRSGPALAAITGLLSVCGVIAAAVAPGLFRVTEHPTPATPAAVTRPRHAVQAIGKPDVRRIIAGNDFVNIEDSILKVQRENQCFTVQTSIDDRLQQFLLQRLDQRHSRYIGIVIMDPKDGRILAMAGYDKTDPSRNPCLDSRFPAASIFKIITAAAAVETCDLEAESILRFDGGKHTLYRSQITPKSSKNATQISLKDSFAQSINPVFGKIGAHRLGREVIENYAEAFGFNREIDFELPIRPSRIEMSDEAYGLAEIASGYNRTTRISPLHGAIITAAIFNSGRIVAPTIVDWIANEEGQTLYQSRAVFHDQAIDRHTSGVLRELMQATVQSGTARREFHKHSDEKIFSRLEIGAKTGSIGDGNADARYDWLVGYAREQRGGGGIVFSVVVAHEDYIGTRAAAYAAMAIKEYFRTHFARVENRGAPEPKS
jgi:cell division protein FtsI/penicillin-binding protein 2